MRMAGVTASGRCRDRRCENARHSCHSVRRPTTLAVLSATNVAQSQVLLINCESRDDSHAHFSRLATKYSAPFVAILLSVAVIVLLSLYQPLVLFGAFVAYAISGYVVSAWVLLRRRRADGVR
jgi:hypothetical protein